MADGVMLGSSVETIDGDEFESNKDGIGVLSGEALPTASDVREG